MNELQLVLLAFALIVVAVMLVLHYRNEAKRNARPSEPKTTAPTHNTEFTESRIQANQAINSMGEGHIPVSNKVQTQFEQLSHPAQEGDEVPKNQGKFCFGVEFDVAVPTPETVDNTQLEKPTVATQRKPRHFVLEVEELKTLEEVGPIGAAADKQPSFGRPANTAVADSENKLAEVTEPQVFVIMVMGSQDFEMEALNKSLLGVGLSFSSQGIYIKKDTLGRAYLHVANVMEPGIFPAMDEERFAQFTTPGVILILELPTSVKAPAAMNDMIMIARKVSQRLNGRLYNAQRQLLRESDIQAMRDSAVAYETVGIQNFH